VPASPLVTTVNAPRSRTPDEYDSDESMDDDVGAAASYDGSGEVAGRSAGRSAAYRCVLAGEGVCACDFGWKMCSTVQRSAFVCLWCANDSGTTQTLMFIRPARLALSSTFVIFAAF
jgi:hypothetical protein